MDRQTQMKFRQVQYAENIYAGFWLIPLVMSLSAIFLAVTTSYIDRRYSINILNGYFAYSLDLVHTREVLSIIATSVISITSVTFSITVLTLSIASNQLGPRLLPNFMKQKPTQIVLGIFIGTFVYTLLILQSLSLNSAEAVTPLLSIFLAIALGIFCFFLLIYFIYFVCHVIQVDNVFSLLLTDLIASIERQYPLSTSDRTSMLDKAISADTANLHDLIKDKIVTYIRANRYGYLQTIDYEALLYQATSNNMIFHCQVIPGKYLIEDMVLIKVYSEFTLDDELIESCMDALQIASRRSTVQDIEFAFEELAEIALRALSPGINNPYLAIHAIDRITQGLSSLQRRRIPDKVLCDELNNIRVIRQISGYEDVVGIAFNRLRQQANRDLSVTISLMTNFRKILELNPPNEMCIALFKQTDCLYEEAKMHVMCDVDKKDLEESYNAVCQLK